MTLNEESNRNFERKALYISQDHCRVLSSAVKELSLLIEDWLAGKFEKVKERHSRIAEFEKEANNIKWSLMDLLSNATTLFQREDIMRLVTTSDMIADNTEAVAYKITLSGSLNLPKPISNELKNMMDTVLKSMDKLRESILMLDQNLSKATEISKEVDEIEEETDGIHRRLIREILDSFDDYKQMIKIYNITEQLEETSDQIKTSADSVRILSMSIHS
jgi:predicted phosphate transport protein (TIGR00153 family)